MNELEEPFGVSVDIVHGSLKKKIVCLKQKRR